MQTIKEKLKRIQLVTIPYRVFYAFKFYIHSMLMIFKCSIKSKELSTFTYNLTANNIEYLLHEISIITNMSYNNIENYYNEIRNNDRLITFVINAIKDSNYKSIKDARCEFGSRIAYYCIIRALKPEVVVENGVELGYTGIVLCTALLKNKSEGNSGKYYGFDKDPNAGFLISQKPYDDIACLIYGESLTTLASFNQPIDFYFSDGGRSYYYEKEEFRLLKEKLCKDGIVVSNKLNFSNALSQLAKEMHKKLIYFREEPLDHWYPGSHIGFMY
jgi:predicted O-methyltransferase YrrM